MGAITVALGLPSLLLLQPQRTRIPRTPPIARHSHTSSRIFASATGNLRRGGVVCSASASWPYGSWATTGAEEEGNRPLEQEQEEPVGRLEFLALGLGVAVSVAVAFFKQSGAGLILIMFLTATTVVMRKELAGLLSVPVAHLNSVQDALALHLSSIRNNVIYWGTGNGATVSTSIESPSLQEKELKAEGLSSAEIEAALTEIAKSVAQLSMVITNLDNKVTSLEKDAVDFRTLSQKNMESVTADIRTLSQKNMESVTADIRTLSQKNMESVRTGPAVERRPKATYTIRKPVASGSVTQLKWDEAVRLADQSKPQVSGYAPFKDANRVEAVENESKALPSTILYDSRGDRVLLLESRPVDVTFEVRENVSPSAPEDSSMKLNLQDVGTGIALKQENAASAEKTEFLFQDAPEANIVQQPKQKAVDVQTTVKDAASQPLLSTSAAAPPRRGRVYNRKEARISMESSESEGYRAVPVTQGKPDTSRLKRIMNGGETFTDLNANAWVQNDAKVPEMSRPIEKPVLEVAATQSSVGWDEFPDSGNSWSDDRGRGATQPQAVQNVLSYDGQDRSSPRGRSRPESEGAKPSSGAEYSGRWPREGDSGATDADFGGNGSSSDTNEGENGGKRRQASSRSENDSDSERGTRDRRPSRASTPSYPPERPETFRKFLDPDEDDEGFQRIIAEVEGLLKEGREGLEGRIEVGVAEGMLYEAADLCEKAVEMRPGSLIAVGMWGNTLLLHGELKLRLSQNLRSMLPEPPSKNLSRREFEEAEEERLSLESTLQDVGEECEQLLVEAGRKYRLALSMDRTDMRALYNWGLALCYRGQLIAEEGGETAAQDADKVFLAAIDKFEAMIGLSDTYAAGALLNWGLAMRDRSRLRPLGSRERQKILSQAKEIFQEALRLDPNYGQARGAVAACTVELKELREYEEEPTKRLKEPPSSSSRGFRDWWG